MAGATLTTFDASLKETYGPGLREAINNSNPILTEATRNTTDFEGRRAVWDVHTSRSNASGARAEGAALPTAGSQGYTQAYDYVMSLYHTIKVSGQVAASSKTNSGAFLRAIEAEMRGAERDVKNDYARQLFGQAKTDGTNLKTGVIATLTSDPSTGATLTMANEPASVMRHFQVGMYVQAINPSGGTARSGGPYQVTAVDVANRTVTIGSAANAAIGSTDYIVRADSSTSATNFGAEVNGLRRLVSTTGTYAGIDPASVTNWKAQAVGSSTTGVSELIFEQAAEAVETDGNGDTPSLFICEHAQRRKLASTLQAQKRYDGRQTTLTSGWKGLEIAQGTLVADRYCPTTTAFALTPAELTEFVLEDWDWDDVDGRVLNKVAGYDQVEARFRTYRNLEVTTRNAHAVISLSDPGV